MAEWADPLFTAPPELVAAVCGGYCHDPFSVLGMHKVSIDQRLIVSVRTFYPFAREMAVRVLDSGEVVPMQRIHSDGFFEALFWKRTEPFPYRLILTEDNGTVREFFDPYAFPLLLSDFDLYLIAQGEHRQLWKALGGHILELEAPNSAGEKVRGVRFAVWAPNALRVSVVGDFNRWDGRVHPMRFRHEAGIWELFLPEALLGGAESVLYKFEVKGRYAGYLQLKANPVGFFHEVRPKSASILWDLGRYRWNDEDWLSRRHEVQRLDKPIAIYEVHLGSWRRGEGGAMANLPRVGRATGSLCAGHGLHPH